MTSTSRRRIEDEFTHQPLTRQRKYQLRMRQQGRCTLCGKPAFTASHCLFHAIEARERRRAGKKLQRRYFGARTYQLQRPNGDGVERNGVTRPA